MQPTLTQMKLQYAVPVLQYSSTVLDDLRCQDVDRDAGTMEHLDEKPEAHYHVPNSLWMPNELNQILARASYPISQYPNPNIPMLVLNFPRSIVQPQ